MSAIRLDEDMHVHSTFSDGVDSLERNLAVATERGLVRLGCVDHVRRDTTYVPDYVAAVRALRPRTDVLLTIGIEAKILDARGTLDLPTHVDGIDFVYVADHQFPGADGPVSPRTVRESIAAGEMPAHAVLDGLVDATIASMRRNASTHRMVLAHLFSLVPKMGLAEDDVSDEAIDRLATAAAETSTIIEVSERWRCPGHRVVRAALRHHVQVVASTDSHRSADIGQYEWVASLEGSSRG